MTKSKAKAIPKDKNAKTAYKLLSGSHSRKEGLQWRTYFKNDEILLTTDEWWKLKDRVKAVREKVIINPFEGRDNG
jgi:hypothetical protein